MWSNKNVSKFAVYITWFNKFDQINLMAPSEYMSFFMSNTLTSNAWLKLAKIQANPKQKPEADL